MDKKNCHNFEKEIVEGNRFEFGKNWKNFLNNLTEEQIIEGEKSLRDFLQIKDLDGKTFIDVGSGSGIMSLAAKRLGASVFSFDYDPSCVWCTDQLRKKYKYQQNGWRIEQGSILDNKYIDSLGKFDMVYSWGVLHHTGDMYKSFDLISRLVKPNGGYLFIAIYNDQGKLSKFWRFIKKIYCKSPKIIKAIMIFFVGIAVWGSRFMIDFIKLKPFESWRNYHHIKRGMSPWYNIIDWVGGYPFEVATPDEVFTFFRKRGFELRKIKTVSGGQGNNQFVFELA